MRAGSDTRTLQLAIGHIPGTALPGDPGNVGTVLRAAHAFGAGSVWVANHGDGTVTRIRP